MIINHSRGFVFVHVPKSAGTSVSRVLEGFSGYMDLEVGGTTLGEKVQPIYKKRFGLAKHASAGEIRSVMGDQRFKSYYSFAIVRNPYTRAFSIYNWLLRQRTRAQHLSPRTLAQLENIGDSFGSFVRSEYFRTEGEDRMLRPQRFWAHLKDGPELTFVGSVESIDEDLNTIVTAIQARGFDSQLRSPTNPKVPKRNESTEEPNALWDMLRQDPELEALIYARYKPDFDTFGYRRFQATSEEPYDETRKKVSKPAPAKGGKKAG